MHPMLSVHETAGPTWTHDNQGNEMVFVVDNGWAKKQPQSFSMTMRLWPIKQKTKGVQIYSY